MKSVVMTADEVYYPSSDGEPMAETGQHVRLMVTLITLLQLRYQKQDDVYVIGNIFLYYEKGNPSAVRSPDVMVIKGVPSIPEVRRPRNRESSTPRTFLLFHAC